jgi:hypothetical protein
VIGMVAVILDQSRKYIWLGLHQEPSPAKTLNITAQGVIVNTIIGPYLDKRKLLLPDKHQQIYR